MGRRHFLAAVSLAGLAAAPVHAQSVPTPVACSAEPLNGSLLANLGVWAKRAGVPVPAAESDTSPFHGWH